jgi:hypothetical protein
MVSKTINLVKYGTGNDGKLNETKVDLIETAFVTSLMLSELQKYFPLVEVCVFEGADSDDHYTIECFKDADVQSAIKKLEEMFVSTLRSDSELILGKETNSTSRHLAEKNQVHIKSNDLDNSIIRFRTLTNIINIFKLKHNQYSQDAAAVLKIG